MIPARQPIRAATADQKPVNADADPGDAGQSDRRNGSAGPGDARRVSDDGKRSGNESAARTGAGNDGRQVANPSPAIGELLRPLRSGQGVRIGACGPTGSGKSWALRLVVKRAAKSIDGIYVCADKPGEAKQWDGQERIDLADCRDRPLVSGARGGSNVIVLSGDPFARRFVDPDSVAQDAWKRAAPPTRLRVGVAVDELRRAAKGQHWRTPDGDLPLIFTEGRAVGLSVFWGCQSPQDIPRDALGQSDLLLFRCEGREAEYLRKYRLVSDELAARMAHLPDHSFAIRRLGQPWDGRIYRF